METEKTPAQLAVDNVKNIINKVKSNQYDASHGKDQIDIYFTLSDRSIEILEADGFKVSEGKQGSKHIVSWNEQVQI